MRLPTIAAALVTATAFGAPAVAHGSSVIRYAYVTAGTPRSLPATTIDSSEPVIYGVLILSRNVAPGTQARFVFSRLRVRYGVERRIPLAVSTPRLAAGDLALVVPLPRGAYRTRGGAWLLSVHVGKTHRGCRFRVRR